MIATSTESIKASAKCRIHWNPTLTKKKLKNQFTRKIYLHKLFDSFEYLQNHIITIPCNLLSEYKNLYNKEINIRPNQPENIIRLLLPRKPNVGIRHNIVRHRGSIVMQNRLAARYSGEVYLVKHDLPFEARSNVIGFVSPEYVNLFDQIDADIRIKLIPIN